MNSGFFFINNSRYQSVRSAVLDSSRLTLTNFLAEEVFLHLFLFDELRISSLCRPTRRLDSLDSTNWAKPPGPRPRPLRGTRRPVKLLKSKNRTVPKQRPAVDLDYAQSLAICLAVAPALSASLLSIGQYFLRCSFCHRIFELAPTPAHFASSFIIYCPQRIHQSSEGIEPLSASIHN